MLKKIAELEQISRRLDPDRVERAELLDQVANYAESFLQQLPGAKTYIRDAGRAGLRNALFDETPAEMADILDVFRAEVDTTGILPASGGQMGYIPGGGLYPSALGDYLADISNRYSGVAFAGPGAAELEWALVTLSALVAARDACGIGPGRTANACVYMSEQAHHCIGKALHVAGLGEARRRIVPMDDRYRMDADVLHQMIREDRNQGLTPWLIAASAGTTDTGAVDPIERIADIAQENELWFHLDAAYGGFFLLCDEAGECLAGIGLADSIVMDPHKGLGLPYGTGAVLVKEGRLLAESNRYYADYMQDAIEPGQTAEREFSPADYSLELTRPFRGPRMWFPLRLFGLQAFRASLAEKIWLARYFHREVGNLAGFEPGPRPDLSIVTFRYLPREGDANLFNKRLLEAVHEDGKVFITSTMIEGKFTLRLAVLNFRTHRETIDYLLAFLRRASASIAGEK
jgi:glutamate/tyrosine decarboxylase-like PLP-dependent enzyme